MRAGARLLRCVAACTPHALAAAQYAVVGDVTLCPRNCIAPLLNASSAPNGDFVGDGMASVLAHEIAEAVTDPQPSPYYFSFSDYDYRIHDSDYFAGWQSDAEGEENADICAWYFGAVNSTSNGKVYNVALGTNRTRFMLQQNFDPAQGGGCTLSTQRASWSPPPPMPPAPAAPAAPAPPLGPGTCVPFLFWGYSSGDYDCGSIVTSLDFTANIAAWSSITIIQQAGVSAAYVEPFLYVAMSAYALLQPTLPVSFVFTYTSGANTVVNTTLAHYSDGPYYGAVDRLVTNCWYGYCTYYYFSLGYCSYYDYWYGDYVQLCALSFRTQAEGTILSADASRTLVSVAVRFPPPAVAPVFTVLAGTTVPPWADGVGSAALFSNPTAVAVDVDGNVYVVDANNRVIRIVDSQTGATSTLAGTPGQYGYTDGYAARFANPAGIATDPTNPGEVVVIDLGACTVRRVDAYGYVSTVAGQQSNCGESVDGQGTSALFNYPSAVVVDKLGYTYVWDLSCIRVISPSPSSSTSAGSLVSVSTLAGRPNSYSSSGMDGTGTAASFANPYYANSMAIDGGGNIYVAEMSYSGNIRRVTSAGTVSTLQLSNTIYYPSDIAVRADGTLLVVSSEVIYSVTAPIQGSTVWSVSRVAGSGAWGFADGVGTNAMFFNPSGIAVTGSGGVAETAYIADSSNNLIRVFSISTAAVTTLAGSRPYGFTDGAGTAAQFFGPSKVAVDASGNVVVTDQYNHVVRYITRSTGQVRTYAGSTAGLGGFTDGVGTNARLDYPNAVALDASGNVYVSEWTTIRKITPSGNVGNVITLAGSPIWGYADGKGSAARFSNVKGLAVDASGTLYAADSYNNVIRKILSDGTVTTLAGSSMGVSGFADGAASAAMFDSPSGVAVRNSAIFVADTNNCRIRTITPNGTVSTFAGSDCYDSSCYYTGSADGVGTNACFWYPIDLTIDASGTLFVAESGSSSIRKIAPDGTVTTIAGAGTPVLDGPPLSYFSGVAVDSTGALIVADAGANIVRILQAPTQQQLQQNAIDLSYTVSASPFLLSTLPLYVSRGFVSGQPWQLESASLEISALDLQCIEYLPAFNLMTSCTTSFTASSVNLTQLYAYGYSPNGASTVTFTLNVNYADGTSVLLWSASTNTYFGVSLPQRIFALNASKLVQSLVFASSSTPAGLFHLDAYAPQVLFAAGPAGPGTPSARRADGSLDNFDVAAGKRAAAASALGALINATGMPVNYRPRPRHASGAGPAGLLPNGDRRELKRGPDGVTRLLPPKRLKTAAAHSKRGSDTASLNAPPPARWTRRAGEAGGDSKPMVRQTLTPEMQRSVQSPRRRQHASFGGRRIID
jgi:hypothetical protein